MAQHHWLGATWTCAVFCPAFDPYFYPFLPPTQSLPHPSPSTMFAVRSTPAVRVSAVAGRALGAKKFNPLAAHVARKAPVAKARFSVSANSGPPSADGSVDIYRDTPLRYMGYANEVGESFVAFLPVWGVPATYGVAGTYARLESMRAREFTRIRLFRQKKEKGSRGTPWCQPSPPDPRTETTQTDPPHPISRTIRSALYVLADTLDKGKKAYDGEAGTCLVLVWRDLYFETDVFRHPRKEHRQTVTFHFSQWGPNSAQATRFDRWARVSR